MLDNPSIEASSVSYRYKFLVVGKIIYVKVSIVLPVSKTLNANLKNCAKLS